jgi:hypothetical protein
VKRGARPWICLACLGVAVLAGCGSSDGSSSASSSKSAPPSSTRPGEAVGYVGLTEQAAIAKAEAADRPWRISREDDEHFMVTQDFVEERVTFEIDDGTVTTATFG